jgi:hypothetical protein
MATVLGVEVDVRDDEAGLGDDGRVVHEWGGSICSSRTPAMVADAPWIQAIHGEPPDARFLSDPSNDPEQENRHQRPASEAHTTFYD